MFFFFFSFSAVSCGKPPEVEGAAPFMTGDTFESTVSYECHPGLRLVGPKNLTCLFDGKWSFPIPSCEGMRDTCNTLYCSLYDIATSYLQMLHPTALSVTLTRGQCTIHIRSCSLLLCIISHLFLPVVLRFFLLVYLSLSLTLSLLHVPLPSLLNMFLPFFLLVSLSLSLSWP